MPILNIQIMQGRSAALNRAVQESIDISGQDVRVIITDIPKTDMGVAGGVTAASLAKP